MNEQIIANISTNVHKAVTLIHKALQIKYSDTCYMPYEVYSTEYVEIVTNVGSSVFTKRYPYTAFTGQNMECLVDNYMNRFDVFTTNCITTEE